MKKEKITIRISSEIKNNLEHEGYSRDLTLSETIRQIIEDFFMDKENLNQTKEYSKNLNPNHLIVQSYIFTEFIFWLYDKKTIPEFNENREFYLELIKLINRIQKSNNFSTEIKYEFNKVQNEIIDYLNGKIQCNNLRFSTLPAPDGFDYNELSNFLYCYRYNNDNDEVLPFNELI